MVGTNQKGVVTSYARNTAIGEKGSRKVAYRALKGTKNIIDVADAVTGTNNADEGCFADELPANLQSSEPPCSKLVRYELGVFDLDSVIRLGPSGASPGDRSSVVGITAASTIFTADQTVNGDAGTIDGQITVSDASFSDHGGTAGVNEGDCPIVEPVDEGAGRHVLEPLMVAVEPLTGLAKDKVSCSSLGSENFPPLNPLLGSVKGALGMLKDKVSCSGLGSEDFPPLNPLLGSAKGALGMLKDKVSCSGLGSEDFPPLNPLLGSAKGALGMLKATPKADREANAGHHVYAKEGTNAEPHGHGENSQIDYSGVDAIGARSSKGVSGHSIAAAQDSSCIINTINGANACPIRNSEIGSAPTSSVLNGYAPSSSNPATGANPKSFPGLGWSLPSPGKQDGYDHCIPDIPTADNLEMTNYSPVKSWKNLVSMPVKTGGTLQFYMPHCTDGKIIAKPPVEAVNEGIDMWKGCLVGQFLDKRLPFPVVRSLINKLWGSREMPDISTTENGLFFFRFRDPAAREWVMNAGPWHLVGRPFILRAWKPGMTSLTSCYHLSQFRSDSITFHWNTGQTHVLGTLLALLESRFTLIHSRRIRQS